MSYQYDIYLNEHRMNVMGGFNWLLKNIFVEPPAHEAYLLNRAAESISHHDESKNSGYESYQYDKYFYGPDENRELIEEQFNEAWLHHIHNNPHHWQHWVLINDDPEQGTVALEMPFKYIIEMICDWWSFSWKTGNLYEIFDWYEKNKDHIILHENTREEVEDILGRIKAKLDEMIAAVTEDEYDDDRR